MNATTPRRRGHHTSIWPTRMAPDAPYVRLHPADENLIGIWIPQDEASDDGQYWGFLHGLTRREARMLARRINECLDATVIR